MPITDCQRLINEIEFFVSRKKAERDRMPPVRIHSNEHVYSDCVPVKTYKDGVRDCYEKLIEIANACDTQARDLEGDYWSQRFMIDRAEHFRTAAVNVAGLA